MHSIITALEDGSNKDVYALYVTLIGNIINTGNEIY